MRNYMATNNVIAVSAALRETAINTEQTLDTTMLWNMASLIDIDPRRQNNDNEAHGKEEVDTIYDRGKLSMWPAAHDMAQPQNIAFLMGYGMGNVVSTSLGAGKKHVIKPIAGSLDDNRDNPSFTAAQRYGNQIAKRRFASLFVDSVTTNFSRDSFVKISASVKGTGKYTDNVIKETLSAAGNAVSLTLTANGVQGADAATRLDNVHRIRVQLTPGVYTEVAYSAVSGAAPAVITITSPGGTVTPVSYEILYIATETTWMTLPARVNESPLEMASTIFNVGGTWNGTTFQGGRSLTSEIKSLEHTLNNNGEVQLPMPIPPSTPIAGIPLRLTRYRIKFPSYRWISRFTISIPAATWPCRKHARNAKTRQSAFWKEYPRGKFRNSERQRPLRQQPTMR